MAGDLSRGGMGKGVQRKSNGRRRKRKNGESQGGSDGPANFREICKGTQRLSHSLIFTQWENMMKLGRKDWVREKKAHKRG